MAETLPALRRAVAADRDAVARVTGAAYKPYVKRLGYKPKPMTADHAPWIEDGSVWVLDTGAGIIGVLVLLDGPDGLLIYNIAVAPAEQHRGNGRRLMAFAEEQAKKLGYARIILYTNEKMTENIRFYEKLGYTPYARLEHPTRGKAWLIHLNKFI